MADMTATTQPGITLRRQIEWFEELVKYNHRHGFDTATITAILASLIRLREIEGDAARYQAFRAVVSKGDLTDKKWKKAFDEWFARYYPEDLLDAVVDAARLRAEHSQECSGAAIDSAIRHLKEKS